jgi:hypothetical protein
MTRSHSTGGIGSDSFILRGRFCSSRRISDTKPSFVGFYGALAESGYICGGGMEMEKLTGMIKVSFKGKVMTKCGPEDK